MSTNVVDIRLAQFQRVARQISAARERHEHEKVDFLLAQADLLFNALKVAVRQ